MNKDFTSDFYGTKNVWFVGTVVERVDDTYVRVRIFGIHPLDKTKVADSDLPLAMVVYPVTGDQTSGGAPTHNLDVDSWVIGFFADYPVCRQPIVTGSIQGTDYSQSNYKTNGGEFVGEGTGDGSGTPNPNPEVDIDATTNIPGGSNVQKTYNYVTMKLTAEGYQGDKHIATSALVGVLMLETSGINPKVVGGYKGRAWGICQWLGGRRSQLFRKFGQTKRLDQQLDFMWWELNNTESNAKSLWLRATNLPDAVAGFCMFERAEEVRNGRVLRSHGNFKKRLQFAYQVYNSMKPTITGGNSNTGTAELGVV